MGLRENAAAAAGRALTDDTQDQLAGDGAETALLPDPMADYEPGNDDPEMVPVHIAWLRVRRDIRAIGKGEVYNQSGTRFNFRGADTVVNVFGPVTLKHGVNVLSTEVEADYGEKTTKSGSKMRECTTLVHWTIMGPMGDTLTLQTRGEALDTADKSTTKAQTVALRTLLLQFGLIPTQDKEPDTDRIERGEDPIRPAVTYLDEICNPHTSAGRLRQIHHELGSTRQLGALVTNEVGDEEQIGAMVARIGKERAAAGDR
ncbi:ERF family protein [Streptomyces sp. NBC_00247]|uniref:ERF family protein n=1 Tax=Streptomyces sp. NBC_00247 TaxID=2975689 RepID=UPI002E2E57E7|nr:ERF family protein [Streptomyces sp. NBC_00247]